MSLNQSICVTLTLWLNHIAEFNEKFAMSVKE